MGLCWMIPDKGKAVKDYIFVIPNGSLTNEKIRAEKTLYEDILILSESKKSNWSEQETPTALMSQAVISFVSKWGHQHKWILFGDRNSTNFLNSGPGFKVIPVSIAS